MRDSLWERPCPLASLADWTNSSITWCRSIAFGNRLRHILPIGFYFVPNPAQNQRASKEGWHLIRRRQYFSSRIPQAEWFFPSQLAQIGCNNWTGLWNRDWI